MSGYAFIYRTLLDHPVFRTDAEAMAFAWMVLRASWNPRTNRYKGHIIELERGQFAMSVRDIGGRLEWSKDRVYRFLNTLTNRDMIATDARQGVMVITIRNYDKYQAIGETCETATEQQPRQDRDSTATQSNEGKKGKKKGVSNETPSAIWKKPADVDPEVWKDFMANRRRRKSGTGATAWKDFNGDLRRVSAKTGLSEAKLIEHAAAKGWAGIYNPNEREVSHDKRSSSPTREVYERLGLGDD